MLKREITYEDFDGNTVTETAYFHISKPELVKLEAEQKEGFQDWIKKMVEAEDNRQIIEVFERIVLMAYGQRSEDGKRFIKSEELTEGFSQTNAYEALFMDLITNETTMAEFIKGALPKDLAGELAKAMTTTNDPTAETPAVQNT